MPSELIVRICRNRDIIQIEEQHTLLESHPMSPKVLEEGALIFWFHSYDARHEKRASVHVGKGSQNDHRDAKVWLEPEILLAKPGRSLKSHELNHALEVIKQNYDYLKGEWQAYKQKAR